MLSQFVTRDSKQQRKKLLGELYNFPEGCMAVGRLDEPSEGLLFITTDGKFSDWITTSGGVAKTYHCQVDGKPNLKEVEKLINGVSISSNGKSRLVTAVQAKVIPEPKLPETNLYIRDDRHGPTSWLKITINSGLFRQVRKMTAAVGCPTLRLVRVGIGAMDLTDLLPSRVKEITYKEICLNFPGFSNCH